MTARATFLVDVFDEHLDELGFLFGQWRAALRDADYTLASVTDLEERIRAHLQGVLVPGERAWPRLLERLDGDDADLVFASAYSILHINHPELTEKVLGAFAILDAEFFTALTMALTHAPLPPNAIETIRATLGARPALRGVAAAEILAFHDALELTGEQLRYFLEDEDPIVRLHGWRLAALIGAQLPPRSYSTGLRDAEPPIAMAALETGAWCGVPGVINALRQLADPALPDQLNALYLLAVIGTPDDTPRMQAALENGELGPQRFNLAGAFGSPALMPIVLRSLAVKDPATAAAAGAAFLRLTGVDISSNERATVPPADGKPPDEFEAEFQDEVMLPDPAKAQREWERLRPQLEGLPRICRGVDASRALDPNVVARIDMLSRRDLFLRARFTQQWQGVMLHVERFPQGATASDQARATTRSAQQLTAAGG